ncbi:DUF5955 family protein [Streptomyces sp. NPDC001663]|uniref:DUF5955 family protein n=1 Tax=Streptomyces sp. NPDC001663 TaxID=3364597 RepID=UPI00367F2621
MAQRRRQRDDRQQASSVSSEAKVRGRNNKVMNGAAGRDLTQNMDSGVAPDELAELRAALAAHAGQVADIEQAEEAVDAIEEELNSDRPRQTRLNLMLTGLTTSIGAATGVLTVVDKVRAVVNSMFT